MPLYPTLEDLLVDQMQNRSSSGQGPQQFRSQVQPSAPLYEPSSTFSLTTGRRYEAVDENHLAVVSPPEILSYATLPSYYESVYQQPQSTSAESPKQCRSSAASNHLPPPPRTSSVVLAQPANGMLSLKDEWLVAPITSQCSGLVKTNLTHGIRRVVLNRNRDKKYGLRMRAVNKGVFIQLVTKDSASAAAGIRFGDQVLSLNGTEVLGMTGQKVMDMMKKTKELVLMLKDRPLARTITLHKNTAGLLGFSHKDNLITAVMKESSASRNGLLINERIVEVDGRNVMAFKSKELKSCLEDASTTVTLTLMPAEFYDELTKKMDWSLMRKQDCGVALE